jgi:thiamine kinase-like enzyme
MEVCVNDTLLERLVSVPLQNICKSTLICYHWHSLKLLKRIEMQLLDALRGRQMVVCWIHGDYWPENLLVTPNGDAVTGIVDWDLSQPMSFPSLDLVNMLLSTRQIEEGKELGIILSDVVKQGAWRQPEQVLWEDARRDLGGKFPEIRESLLIFWLQHLSANLKKAWRYSVNPVWAFNTFTRVITSL